MLQRFWDAREYYPNMQQIVPEDYQPALGKEPPTSGQIENIA
jgi:hypothetical protein